MLRCPRCGHRDHKSVWPFWLREEHLRCPKCWDEGRSVEPERDVDPEKGSDS